MSRATRARSSATARPNSAARIARQTPTSRIAVGEEPEEVALRDVLARERRREDGVQLGEEPDRRAEGEPAVEVLAVRPVAKPEADEGGEPEQRLERERAGEQVGLARGPGESRAATVRAPRQIAQSA